MGRKIISNKKKGENAQPDITETDQALLDAFFDENADMEGFLSFEELSDSDFLTCDGKAEKKSLSKKVEGKRKKKQKTDHIQTNTDTKKPVNYQLFPDGSPWSSFSLHPHLQHAMQNAAFDQPTEIQSNTLSALIVSVDASSGCAIMDTTRDVIGTAPTGSGKTLAFGLPILHTLLCEEDSQEPHRTISALILVPTRELGLQVGDHLMAVARGSPVRIITLIGGIALPKQERLLGKQVDVLIATPGRLSKFVKEGENLQISERLKGVRFLVLDEVDRMTEAHHFKELEDVFALLSTSRQTFVFSATLPKESSQSWMKKIPFVDKKPLLITSNGSLSLMGGIPTQDIQENKVKCTNEERDTFLYYFLLEHPGRTVIFVNAVDAIRRLVPMLQQLGFSAAWGIHSQMPQRQRMKNLDRFKGNENAILVASDVAGRGLDIPAVQYVLHYHVPRCLDIYIHRTGRTGRAGKKGFSLLLLTPKEFPTFKKWSSSIPQGRLVAYEYDHHVWRQLQERLALAAKIDALQHQMRKTGHELSWSKRAAKILEMEESDDESAMDPAEKKKRRALDEMKRQLKTILDQPLLPKGFSKSFITKPSNVNYPIYDKLVKSRGQDQH